MRQIKRDPAAKVNDPLREIITVAARVKHSRPAVNYAVEVAAYPPIDEYRKFVESLSAELEKITAMAVEAMLERDEAELKR